MATVSKSKTALTPIGDYLQEGLLALVPYYRSGYKSVVMTRKSSYQDKRAVSWLIQTIANYFCMDINQMRKSYGSLLKLRNNFSMAFTPKLVLMPVQLRKSEDPDEDKCGYVSTKEVDKINATPKLGDAENPWRTEIIFKNGRRLPTLNIKSTLTRRLSESELVLTDYLKRNGKYTPDRPLTSEMFLDMLPDCDCLMLDFFVGMLSRGKDAKMAIAENSLPNPFPRLSPDLFQRKPGINEQSKEDQKREHENKGEKIISLHNVKTQNVHKPSKQGQIGS